MDPLEVVKIVVPAVIQMTGFIVATGWAITQYRRSSRAERQKPLREEQLRLANRITALCGRLATTTDGEAFSQARLEFWELYHGPLILIEDAEVEAAMVRFGRDLATASFEGSRDDLKVEALRLAAATRALIEKSWDVDLGMLRNTRRNP